jgi:hypothetical protein
MFVGLLLTILLIVFLTTAIFTITMNVIWLDFLWLESLEDELTASDYQMYALRSTEDLSAAANPGVYDQLMTRQQEHSKIEDV